MRMSYDLNFLSMVCMCVLLQAFLYLDKNQNIDVTFQCQATIVGSVREALDQQNSPQCDFVTATTLAPTVTTIPTTTTTTTTTSRYLIFTADKNFLIRT